MFKRVIEQHNTKKASSKALKAFVLNICARKRLANAKIFLVMLASGLRE
jgi:hypothetical protein